MNPLFTPPNKPSRDSSPSSKQDNDRKLWKKRRRSPHLKSSNYQTTKLYWGIINTLPGYYRIPEALIKIGFIAREIRLKDKFISINTSREKNLQTPIAQVPSETIVKMNRFLYKRGVEQDHLSNESKSVIGDIWEASNLNIPPSRADGAVAEHNNETYVSIELKSNSNNIRGLAEETLSNSQQGNVLTDTISNRERELDREVDDEDMNFGSDVLEDTELHKGS